MRDLWSFPQSPLVVIRAFAWAALPISPNVFGPSSETAARIPWNFRWLLLIRSWASCLPNCLESPNGKYA
jgi:hypothetical protein